MNIQPKHSQLFREKYARVCKMYSEGFKIRDIGETTGMSEGRVNEVVREYNLPKRKVRRV